MQKMKVSEIKISSNQTEKDIDNQFLKSVASSNLRVQVETISPKEQQIIHQLQINLNQLVELKEFTLIIDKKSIISSNGYEQISEGLKHLSNLQVLYLKIRQGCFLRNSGISSFSKAIQCLQNLRELHIHIDQNNYLSQIGYQAIRDALAIKQNLEKLSISIIQNQTVRNLGLQEVLLGIGFLKNLKQLQLSLSTSSFDCNNSQQLGKSLKELRTLKTLKISMDQLYGDVIEEEFAKSIGELTNLEILQLNFQKGYPLKKEIVTLLIESCTKLKKINDFSIQGLISDDDYQNQMNFANVFHKSEQLKILQLDINIWSQFSDEFILVLAQNLEQLSRLENLKLQIFPNTLDFQNYGLIRLFEAIKHLKYLQSFSLKIFQNNSLTSAAEEILGDILRDVKSLRELNLYLDKKIIGSNSTCKIVRQLGQQVNLEILHLTILSNLGQEQKKEVYEQIGYLVKLTDLSINLGAEEPHLSSSYQLLGDGNPNADSVLSKNLSGLKNLVKLNINRKLNLVEDFEILSCPANIQNLVTYNFKQFNYFEKLCIIDSQNYNKFLNRLSEINLDISRDMFIDDENDIDLKDLPIIIDQLKNLKKLTLSCNFPSFSDNKIQKFHLESFSSLHQLQQLNLSLTLRQFQPIQFSEMFTGLGHLKQLTLQISICSVSFNVIPYFEDILNGFSHLQSLESLQLDMNLETSQGSQIKWGQLISHLKNLQEFKFKVSALLSEEQKIDLFGVISESKMLRSLQIYSLNNNFCSLKHIMSLFDLSHLRKISLKDNQGFMIHSDQLSNTKGISFTKAKKSSEIVQINNSSVLLNKVLNKFSSKNIQKIDIVLYQQQEYAIDFFESLLLQIREQEYLSKFSLQLEQDKNSNLVNSPPEISECSENEIPEEENNSVNYLNKFVLKINSQFFNINHAELIGREMKQYPFLKNLIIEIYSLNSNASAGLEIIFENMVHLENIAKLDVNVKSQTALNERVLNVFGQSLEKLQTLNSLTMKLEEQKDISEDSFMSLSQNLKHLSNLREISLEIKNALSEKVEITLQESLSCLYRLRSMKIDLNNYCLIEPLDQRYLRESISSHSYGNPLRGLKQGRKLKRSSIHSIQFLKPSVQLQYLRSTFSKIQLTQFRSEDILIINTMFQDCKYDFLVGIEFQKNCSFSEDNQIYFVLQNRNMFYVNILNCLQKNLFNMNEKIQNSLVLNLTYEEDDGNGNDPGVFQNIFCKLKKVKDSSEMCTFIQYNSFCDSQNKEMKKLTDSFNNIKKINKLQINIDIETYLIQNQKQHLIRLLSSQNSIHMLHIFITASDNLSTQFYQELVLCARKITSLNNFKIRIEQNVYYREIFKLRTLIIKKFPYLVLNGTRSQINLE